MKIKIVILIILLSFSTMGFKGTPQPDWVTSSGMDTQFPKEKYFVAFASSPKKGKIEGKKEIAEKNAKKNIVNQISQLINEDLVNSWLFSDGLTDEVVSSEFTSVIIHVVSESIENVLEDIQIVSGYYNKKKKIYYTLAILNRKTESFKIKKKISRLNFKANRIFEKAILHDKTGNFDYALKCLFEAEKKKFDAASSGIVYLAIRLAEEAFFGLPDQKFQLVEIEKKLEDLIGNLNITPKPPIEITVSNPEKIKPVNVDLSRSILGKNIPVINSLLIATFKEGGGRIQRKVKTSSEGTCSFKIESINPNSSNIAEIKIEFDTHSLDKYYRNPFSERWFRELQKKSASFRFIFN